MGGTPISHRRKLRSSASLEERVCGLCAERSIDVKNVGKMQRQSEANLFVEDCIGILRMEGENRSMNLPGYYSSGQFARMANVSIRTIRFYDKQNILKPSYVNPSGARFYTDSDFARLQQILLLKYLGFSLDDIREMTINDTDYHFMLTSLKMQKKLVQDRIEQMQLVETCH